MYIKTDDNVVGKWSTRQWIGWPSFRSQINITANLFVSNIFSTAGNMEKSKSKSTTNVTKTAFIGKKSATNILVAWKLLAETFSKPKTL